MKRRDLLKASPNISIAEAGRRMAKKNVGAMAVIDRGGHLIGIFTERDIVFRVVAQQLDLNTTSVGDVMTRSVHTIDADETFGRALLIMHDNKFRHLPVLEHGKLIGMISGRSALDPELEDFVSESRRRDYLSQEPGRHPSLKLVKE
jgi:CBS domain-containing protein